MIYRLFGLFIICMFATLVNLNADLPEKNNQSIELRAAIDVGSGASRMKIAEVDVKTNKIVSIVFNGELSVPYSTSLANSGNGMFDTEVKATSLASIEYFKNVAEYYGVQKIVGVATAAFRNAKNAPELTQEIKSLTGINIHIIDQELEGILAFSAVTANSSLNQENILVWDIGGGSLQFTSLLPNGGYQVYKGDIGSISFKNHIIQNVQRKNSVAVPSPNPMSVQDITHGISYAAKLSNDIDPFTKMKIADQDIHVIGVGSIFPSVLKLMEKERVIHKKDLCKTVYTLEGATDSDFGNTPYSSVELSNASYVLGMMHGLNMTQIIVEKVNNADGALIYAPFWES